MGAVGTTITAQFSRPIEARIMRRFKFGSSIAQLADIGAGIVRLSRDARRRAGFLLIAVAMACLGVVSSATANPAIVIDVATGKVLYADEATKPWYPASLTKLMTFYVALSAVRDHKISFDTPIVISARAARAVPSKMGFKPGTEVTLGNALKMLMVKSANDLAIAVAEAVSGSVEAFAEDMNADAAKLGMRQSHFVNPNGLPDPDHVSSAHDLAILARAIYLTFPESTSILSIGALRLGDEIIPTYNKLLGRYPGADGMKTGFTCAAGFNLVASAQREGQHYIAIVLGAPSSPLRTLKAAVLLDRAFDGIDHPEETLDELGGSSPGPAPDMHNSVCRHRAKAAKAFRAEIDRLEAPLLKQTAETIRAPAPLAFFTGGATLDRLTPVAPTIALMPKPVFDPVPVHVGPEPGYQGPVAEARPAHSPVGTEAPPETASAYVQAKPQGLAGSPLKPDITALPLKRGHGMHKHAAKRTQYHIAKAKTRKHHSVILHGRIHKATAKPSIARPYTHKLTKKPASKVQKHLSKRHVSEHIAVKGRTHKTTSTRAAKARESKAHESSRRTGKAKVVKLASPDRQ